MKNMIAALLLLLSAPAMACTEMLGFSQSLSVYKSIDTEILPWQGKVQGGATLRDWRKPRSWVWNIPVRKRVCEQDEVTQVVFTVSNHVLPMQTWIDWTEEAIVNIRDKYPSVTNIILQPVVGGPMDGQCIFDGAVVRATSNHPDIDAALFTVSQRHTDVEFGLSPEVQDCRDYSDAKGHLRASGNNYVADQMEAYYSGSQPPPVCVPVVCD